MAERKQEESYITDSVGNKIRVTSVLNAYQMKINTLVNENVTLTAKLQDLQEKLQREKEPTVPPKQK